MNKACLKYIFSFCLLLTGIVARPQQPEESLPFLGFKTGLNIGRFTDVIFQPERFSMEGSVDLNFGNKYFAVAEGGYSKTNLEKENYNYRSEGYFVKLGIDYNMLKKYPSDFLGVGIRVGRSAFSHDANKVMISDEHWGDNHLNIPSENLSTYWVEASFGLKAEIFENIYLGWNALIKVKLAGGHPGFQPLNIPGYGNGINSINLGANYYIYYQIPYHPKK